MTSTEVRELCTVVRGSSPRPKGDPRYYGGNVPRLMVSDVSRDGMYVTPRTDSLTEEGARKSRPMKTGDIVIAVSGDPGEPSILTIDACIHDGFVGLRELKDDLVYPPYFYRYFKFFKNFSQSQAVGAIYKNLTTDQIKQLKIPLPPLDEQKRIASILDAADAYRQKTKALLTKYDELTQSLFLEMFGDPVANNKGLRETQLGELTEKITTGSTPKGGKENYVKSGIPFIRCQNVWRGYFNMNDVAHITEAMHSSLMKSSLKHGDILMTKTGRLSTVNSSLGRSAMYLGKNDNANISTDVFLIRLKENVSKWYVSYILSSDLYNSYLRGSSVGGTDKRHLYKEHLEKLKIILPPLDLQNQFTAHIQAIESQKSQTSQPLLPGSPREGLK